jgi:hypothetical protein
MKQVFIYALCDPDTGEIRYVGKANDVVVRYGKHLKDKEDTYKARWIRKLTANGKKPMLEILESVEMEGWQEAEKFWIRYFRFLGMELVNTAEGGMGAIIVSDEVKARKAESIRKFWLNPENKQKRSLISKAALSDPEVRKKMSDGIRASKGSPEARELISKRSKEVASRPGAKDIRSNIAKNIWITEEARKRHSDTLKIALAKPEAKARQIEASRKMTATKEWREKASIAQTIAQRRPELMMQKSEQMKAIHASRRAAIGLPSMNSIERARAERESLFQRNKRAAKSKQRTTSIP